MTNLYEIISDWQIYSLPHQIKLFKEITYRTTYMVESAIKDDSIELAYHCLAIDESIITDKL